MEPEEIESSLQWQKTPEAFIVPIIFAVIFIVGVLGNVMLIIVFLRNKNIRNVPNTFIVSLAVADLLVILTCVPLFSIYFTLESWPWGESMCKILWSIDKFSFAIRAFMLTVLAIERFIAIYKPLHITVGSPVKVAAFFWIIAIFCAVPTFLGSHVFSFTHTREHGTAFNYELKNETIDICIPVPKTWELKHIYTYTLAKCVLFYVIPLIVIAVLYALIARHLLRTAKSQNERQQNLASKKVAVTVFTLAVIFVICFLPGYIYVFWVIFDKNKYEYFEILHYLSIFGFCSKYLNSCANPIALYCLNGEFRKLFIRYIGCKCAKNQDERATSTRIQYSVLREHASLTPTMNQPIEGQETSLTLEKRVTNVYFNELNNVNGKQNV